MSGRRPRALVASVGAITSQGPTSADLWRNVAAGEVAIRRVRQMPMQGFGTRVGAEVVDVLPTSDYRRPPGHREPAVDFALIAAEEAMAGSDRLASAVPPERWGLVLGTCNAGLESAEMWYLRDIGWTSNEPEMLLLAPPQAIAEILASAFSIKGPVLSVNTACAAGANALGWAADLIRSGSVDAVLAGGTDALSQIVFAGFTALESLSPESAAPYSRTRQGLSLGEGSGMLVLVSDSVAERVGLRPLAELRSYGLSADGYHPTAPHPEGEGAARAIRAALRAGGVGPEQVAYINGHGTGTPKNDSAESAAIHSALGEHAQTVMVSSTKSMIGHLLGAAGAVEAIVTVGAIEHQFAPPTANFAAEDPECRLDYVPNHGRDARIDVALSNNFAFGGNNACLVLCRPEAFPSPPPEPRLDRVVITGLAALTPAGDDLAAAAAALAAGRDALIRTQRRRVGRVEIDVGDVLTPRDMRRMDRLSVMAVLEAKAALADAGIRVDGENRHRVGLVFATGIGPMDTMERFGSALVDEGPQAANPAIFPNTVYNAAAGQIAIHTGVVGSTSTVTTGHAAGATGICYAYDLAAQDEADAMLVVAADTLTDLLIRAYGELGIFARNPEYGLAEGCAGLVMERLESARGRRARIYGEVLSTAITSDARGLARVDVHGRGLERAMRQAVERAGAQPGDVDELWSGCSGNRIADQAEAIAIDRVFGDRRLPVHQPKRLLGDPMGAGVVLGAALALGSAERRDRPALALVNSSSLGGTHVSILLRLGGP